MDNEMPLGSWLGHHEGVAIGEEQLDFSGYPLCDWLCDYPIEDNVIEPVPLQSIAPLDHSFFPTQDLFQDELYGMFDGEIGFWEAKKDVDVVGGAVSSCGGEKRKGEERDEERTRVGEWPCREEKVITFEEVSRYFYMPITQAAKELNVGLTLLKKKCRELGIPRWPHRKMKSLQSLIKNVQELGREDGEVGEAQMRSAVEILERERKLMEKEPGMQLEEKTKRLRQACFKANFKKRRQFVHATPPPPPPSEDDEKQVVVLQQHHHHRQASSSSSPSSATYLYMQDHHHHQQLY